MTVRPISSAGSAFHSLHATSQAMQPKQSEDSVKKPYDRPGSILLPSES
jgi:hypothetical protein